MRSPLLKKLPGAVTVLCMVCALASSKLDWHWAAQEGLWLGVLAVFIWAVWDKDMPETRDQTARAAQPGLYEGSRYDGGAGGAGGDN